ncbi:hypothetical protein JFT91_13040 [Pseudomonas sp. TH08]|uniref:hypothetical protein n=1 Tax=unclassified Pseudomonas TaxID=196821 RepID=UPI001912B81B|nr:MULTISPECIES: hypothetical protein [unclassified Pseudomonas]MBK5527809.1 hypothetical protein [Pseudomonas sp. TH06]MBK5533520.1 hypothetical protein [Pseudomonas sp. TH08]
MKRLTCGLGLCLVMATPAIEAASREIRALFQPDSSQPNKNVFVNQTPNSGYCEGYPSECKDNNMFSIQLPVRFNSTRALMPNDSIDLRVPANWRPLTVTNAETGEAETVEVRIIGIGSQYILSDPAYKLVGVTDPLEGHQKLWTGSSWVYAPAPCQYSGVGAYGDNRYRFFWKAPVEAACSKVAAFSIPSMYFDTLDFAYELRTPNPLGMSSGLYTGSMTYSIGPTGDFSLGPLMTPDDGALNLDFVLDVQHTLKVDLPPGGNRVVLEPEGGWMRWIDSGKKPIKIYRDQQFYLSASSRFKVMMLCSSTGGPRCKMMSPKGASTEVETYLTLPAGITGPGGVDVKLYQLQYNTWGGPFQPSIYVDRKVGSLRFEIPKDAIDFLIRPGLSDTFTGNITVIWDSEV